MSLGRRLFVSAAAVIWIAAVATAFAALERYAATPGPARKSGEAATAFLARERAPGRSLLVMAVHPRCPCTRASLAELGDLLARRAGECDALLLEFRPKQPPADWPVASATRELGGVTVRVVPDEEGALARDLGAGTSGHVVFVDAHGRLQFRGGITLSRGHRGVSAAHEAILRGLQEQPVELCEAPVFGCELNNPCAAAGNP